MCEASAPGGATPMRPRRTPAIPLEGSLLRPPADPTVRVDEMVERALRRGSSGNVDLWNDLARRLDPAEFRPKLSGDIELKSFPLRWGNDYAMVANPRD